MSNPNYGTVTLVEALEQDVLDLSELIDQMERSCINFHEGYERATEMLRHLHKATSPLGEMRNALTYWREGIEKEEASIRETENSLRGEQ